MPTKQGEFDTKIFFRYVIIASFVLSTFHLNHPVAQDPDFNTMQPSHGVDVVCISAAGYTLLLP